MISVVQGSNWNRCGTVKGLLRIYCRVPECSSSRLNWVPPPHILKASVAPSLGPKGGGSNTRMGGWLRVPNSDDLTDTLVLYIVIPLRVGPTQSFLSVSITVHYAGDYKDMSSMRGLQRDVVYVA